MGSWLGPPLCILYLSFCFIESFSLKNKIKANLLKFSQPKLFYSFYSILLFFLMSSPLFSNQTLNYKSLKSLTQFRWAKFKNLHGSRIFSINFRVIDYDNEMFIKGQTKNRICTYVIFFLATCHIIENNTLKYHTLKKKKSKIPLFLLKIFEKYLKNSIKFIKSIKQHTWLSK